MATTIYLAIWIPFWNSLDSVRRIHNDLELVAILFFALLALFDAFAHWSEEKNREKIFGEIGVWCFFIAVLCEAVAYPYGHRNDTLSEQVIVSLYEKAEGASAAAGTALQNAIAANGKAIEAQGNAQEASKQAGKIKGRLTSLSSEADDLGIDLDAMEATISARRVTDEKGLEEDLRKEFKGRHIVFKSYAGLGSDEPFWLCSQLFQIATKAEVEPINRCATVPIPQVPATNISIDAPTIEEGQELGMVLKKQRVDEGWQIGRVPGFLVMLHGGMPELAVLVGVRPSIPFFPQLNMHGKAKAKAAAKHTALSQQK